MLLEPLFDVKPYTRTVYFPLPRMLFGDGLGDYERRMNAPLLGGEGTISDLFQVIASMLLEQELMGENLENYSFKYTPLIDDRGQQMYSGVTSGRIYREAEKEVKRKWGEETCLMIVNLNSDKTHVTRTGTVVLCPANITIANLKLAIIRSPNGNDIVGYCPLSPYTPIEIETILRESGNRAAFDEQHKMIKRFLEVKFFDLVLKQIREMEVNGPIILQYGRSPWKNVQRKTIIQLGTFNGN
jgi:hypothetical protein